MATARRGLLIIPLGLALASVLYGQDAVSVPKVQSFQAANELVQPEWRYTRFGWEDANAWVAVPAIPTAKPMIHPIAVSVLILFAALAAMLWASEEYDFDRLFAGQNRRRRDRRDDQRANP
ncbi:MAG TPA: hypothetical protein PKD54_15760 [Pirellulaceae bacterium]|nr:hypothetical protein [Pirellulaceae bacterium]